MPLESAAYIHQLNAANPASSDRLMQGDDHIRLLKATLKATFPKLTGPVEVDETFLNEGIKSGLVPFGVITLFYGTVAPTGWAICNGQRVNKSDGSGSIVTPDLRGRVAIGASETLALGSITGQASRTITTEVAGGHTPSVSLEVSGSHTHTGSVSVATSRTGITTALSTRRVDDGGSASGIVTGVTVNDPGHTHSTALSVDAAGNHTHAATAQAVPGHAHAATVDVTQPSLALHYIIKV